MASAALPEQAMQAEQLAELQAPPSPKAVGPGSASSGAEAEEQEEEHDDEENVDWGGEEPGARMEITPEVRQELKEDMEEDVSTQRQRRIDTASV